MNNPILSVSNSEESILKVKRPKGGEIAGTLYKGSTTNAYSRRACGSIPASS